MEKSEGEELQPDGNSHELDAPPWLRVESTLMATARLIRREYDSELAVLGLNLTSASLLMYVVEKDSLNQTALARRLDVGRAAAGLVIDGLENAGLVKRQPDEDDRRTRLVVPTADGNELAARVAQIDIGIRDCLRSGVSRAARLQLSELLMQMQQNLHDRLDTDC